MIFSLVLWFHHLCFPSLKLISRTKFKNHIYHLAFNMKPKTTMYVGLKPGEDPRVLLAGLVTPGSGLGGGGCALEAAPGSTSSSRMEQTPGLSSRAPWHLGKRLRFAEKGTAPLSTDGFRNFLWGLVFVVEELILLSNAQCYKLGFHLLH